MGAMRPSSRLGRHAISAVRLLLAGALLLVTLASPADAQRGLGKRRPRPPEQAPAAEPAPGEYALEGSQAIEAVNRGEGRQALAYYERAAAEAEKDGNQVRAARAWHAAAVVANRLGRYQKGIQSASRSIELFKKVNARELTQGDLGTWGSSYGHLGAAYRAVGDLAQANKVLDVINGLVVRFLHQDFEARKQYVIEDLPINSTAGDQILLVLSRASLKSSEVTAQYQFMRNEAPVSAPVALSDGAPVFGNDRRNWTRAEFFVFEPTGLPAK